ncbi:MAG: hypothetical protein IJ607_05535 [Bacteroidaceae bacterium]|nr:hypothetical protein [Bacteroidaceae bacterium]
MARPIKETPILKGEDATRFRWNLEHPSPSSAQRKERAREIYSILKANNPECDFFK